MHKTMTLVRRFLPSLLVLMPLNPSTSLSQIVNFPLTVKYNTATAHSLLCSFGEMVDSTDFLVKSTGTSGDACSVPLFGDAQITFRAASHHKSRPSSTPRRTTDFILSVDGASKDQFGWICTKFYESRKLYDGISMEELRVVVDEHFKSQPPHPGYDASRSVDGKATKDLFSDDSAIRDLMEHGFVIIDDAPKTSLFSNEKLSQFLVDKSDQEPHRFDTVAYLKRDQAVVCGLEKQFDLLMSIAAYLNDNLKLKASSHEPILPGTRANPLTNPPSIQAAEYGENEFYVAHSDNSLKETNKRNNFRCFTCILYCNEDWAAEDGGALRLYLNSGNVVVPGVAKRSCRHTDINPVNGRLIIFDSTFVHSVESVTHRTRKRRALTLWIKRPEDSGVHGEQSYFT